MRFRLAPGIPFLLAVSGAIGCGASKAEGGGDAKGGAAGGGSGPVAGAAPGGMGGAGSGPTPPWGLRQFGTATNDEASDVAIDGAGNVFVTGHTFANLDEATSNGSTDIFLVKYTSAGVRQWTRQLGSSEGDEQGRVATDAAGNVYLTGATGGTLPGSVAIGEYDAFLAKYGGDGVLAWVRVIGTTGDELASGIVLDAGGNVLVTGYTTGGLDGTNAGGYDAFVTKFDASGTELWIRQFGSEAVEIAVGLALDGMGNIYVTGQTQGGALDGNPNIGQSDAFLVKYDAAGTKVWTRQFGTSDYDGPAGVVTDASGSIFVGGFTSGSLDANVNAGMKDFFLAKFSSEGALAWAKQLGTPSDEAPLDVAIDAAGGVYVAGYTQGAFGGNASAGGQDALIVKFDGAGQTVWSRQFGSSLSEFANGIGTDAANALFAVGATTGALEGNTNAGGTDAFSVKYDLAGERR